MAIDKKYPFLLKAVIVYRLISCTSNCRATAPALASPGQSRLVTPVFSHSQFYSLFMFLFTQYTHRTIHPQNAYNLIQSSLESTEWLHWLWSELRAPAPQTGFQPEEGLTHKLGIPAQKCNPQIPNPLAACLWTSQGLQKPEPFADFFFPPVLWKKAPTTLTNPL